MMTTNTQKPALPLEITDAVIDHLHSDISALGACSVVCSDWLVRSRHHIFSTVQLWPWRVRRFFELASSAGCTFKNHVHHIELDDAKSKNGRSQPLQTTPAASPDDAPKNDSENNVIFIDAMSKSDLPCLAHVRSIQVRNVNWTSLTPHDQATLRSRLAKFTKLERLEFHDVVFHDLREVVRIVHLFPAIVHLTANLTFMKYLEHNIDCASRLKMPNQLRSLELGTDDGIPVVLTCVESGHSTPHVFGLKLHNIRPHHLHHIRRVLRHSGKNIQKLTLAFERAEFIRGSQDSLVNAIDLSRLSQLKVLAIAGLGLSKTSSPHTLESAIPHILEGIESSCLDTIELQFHIDADTHESLDLLDWPHLEKVLLALHFFGLGQVRVLLDKVRSNRDNELVDPTLVGDRIRACLPELNRRGVLYLQQVEAGGTDELIEFEGEEK
ncbi:hypothetical protein CVT24_008621 [Panaeolus cyanescens]|uniref:F-box domain-containing protein n=1 Tax=Panaeolus cyanescens TaxID=181874 RepID=A0A409VB73_9AGAR|nr:hypothetical protein CVT24_008621 [Panaeolus cyanescens]